MEKEVKLSAEEIIEYIRENVETHDLLELSYNRIYAPGEVLYVDNEDDETKEGLRVTMQLTGEMLNQTVEVDMHEIKDDLLEVRHIKKETTHTTILVVVES
ncbi:MAG: hypothetical protein CVV28_08585 [Methanobacteriales archaeon HGW-Methanobacteriales-1]|jgi:hypothetical protein|nr:MAG: hypothetical protein CVV28_08585 [Methanobacteriales archaeon HGW-Methanobacteriales-1]